MLQALAAWILTDNLSTAIILGLIACVILFLADPEVKFYARMIPGAAVIGVFAIIILKNNLQIFERIRFCRDFMRLDPVDFSEKDLATVRRRLQQFRKHRTI